jgi:hypothetical protein
VDPWAVDRVVAVSPSSGGDFDAAYLLKLSIGPSTRDVLVEFEAPSAVASGGYAEEVTRAFLRDEEPPQRIVVERTGAVRVLTGPREREPGEASPRSGLGRTTRDPQRARNRRRG